MESTTANLSPNSSSPGYDYYDYYYNYDESIANVPLGELVPVTLTYSLTLLLGLVGNCLVIFSVSYYRRMRTVTNIFLLSLASADLLLVLVCVPIKAAAFFAYTWQFGEVLCKLVYYIQNYSMVCSVLTLTVISIERVVAVVFPLQAKYLCTMRHAQMVVVGVWIFSAALALPTLFIYIHQEVGSRHKAFWCLKNHTEERWIIAYEVYMLALLFVIPLLIMILAYSVIAVKVWHVNDMRAGGRVISPPVESRRRFVAKTDRSDRYLLTNGRTRTLVQHNYRPPKRQTSEERETRRQVVGMLVIVLLLFVLCWGPILTNNVLTALGYLHYLHYGYLKPMRQVFLLMSYFNSCLNPIVYAFFSHNFRQSFKLAICACVKGKAFMRAYRYSISAASTRATAVHSNGRVRSSLYERDLGNVSSDNDMTRSPTSYSVEMVELQKLSM